MSLPSTTVCPAAYVPTNEPGACPWRSAGVWPPPQPASESTTATSTAASHARGPDSDGTAPRTRRYWRLRGTRLLATRRPREPTLPNDGSRCGWQKAAKMSWIMARVVFPSCSRTAVRPTPMLLAELYAEAAGLPATVFVVRSRALRRGDFQAPRGLPACYLSPVVQKKPIATGRTETILYQDFVRLLFMTFQRNTAPVATIPHTNITGRENKSTSKTTSYAFISMPFCPRDR